MIRKILFTLLAFATLPAYADAPTQFCFSSSKITEMWQQTASHDDNAPDGYDALFNLLVSNNESGNQSDAGCITAQELTQICKNTWGDNHEPCEQFVYEITTPAETPSFKPLTFSNVLQKTDFSNIDPDIFRQAMNKSIARRGQNRNVVSKLQDMGAVFVEQAKEKQIDPFLSASIAMYESTYGTSTKARNLNNIAGLQGKNGYINFNTVQDSIASQAATIRTWIATKTLDGLAHSGHYCDKSVAATWNSAITSIARRLYKNYNDILQNK